MARQPGQIVELVRRVEGRDVVFVGRAGCYWLDLDTGFRVFFQSRGGRWTVTRAGSPAVLAEGASLTEAYVRVRRHYLAARRIAG